MNRADFEALLGDLAAEQDELDQLVASLDAAGWTTPTPAEGWDVRDQIAHLAATDDWAVSSLTDPAEFQRRLADLGSSSDRRGETVRRGLLGCTVPDEGVLSWWRATRRKTGAALRAHEPRDRVPWFGPEMSVASLGTARLMETWAHGQDVVDALGRSRTPTARLRHIADLGVRTRPFVYASRNLAIPDDLVRVELTGPRGEHWSWGPDDASSRVSGDALDWCLVVTQRRNPADTGLHVEGDAAREWVGIAQAFAGAPTEHRPPCG